MNQFYPLPQHNLALIEQDIRSLRHDIRVRAQYGFTTDHLEKALKSLRRRRWMIQGDDELVTARRKWRGI